MNEDDVLGLLKLSRLEKVSSRRQGHVSCSSVLFPFLHQKNFLHTLDDECQ